MTQLKAEKQLAAIVFHLKRLEQAIYRAKDSGLIKYDDYVTESPIRPLGEIETRIKKTTEKQLAELVYQRINEEYWSKK